MLFTLPPTSLPSHLNTPWSSDASTGCIPPAQAQVTLVASASHSKRPYPTLLLCIKNSSSALSCSSHSTHCLNLLLWETLNMVSPHFGTQRQRARVLSLPSPCLGGYGNHPSYPLTPVTRDKLAAVVLLLLPSTAGQAGRKEKSTCWGPLYLSHSRQTVVSFWMPMIILNIVCCKLAPA